jgi:hypothetical protein
MQPTVCTETSKLSFKAVLLHNRNKYPSIPTAHEGNIQQYTSVCETSNMMNISDISAEFEREHTSPWFTH